MVWKIRLVSSILENRHTRCLHKTSQNSTKTYNIQYPSNSLPGTVQVSCDPRKTMTVIKIPMWKRFSWLRVFMGPSKLKIKRACTCYTLLKRHNLGFTSSMVLKMMGRQDSKTPVALRTKYPNFISVFTWNLDEGEIFENANTLCSWTFMGSGITISKLLPSVWNYLRGIEINPVYFKQFWLEKTDEIISTKGPRRISVCSFFIMCVGISLGRRKV